MEMVIHLLALFAGITAHVMKQIVAAKRIGGDPGIVHYILANREETILALACSFGMWLVLPELPLFFPDLSAAVGLTSKQTAVGSFAAGYMGNSLADILGGRLARLVR